MGMELERLEHLVRGGDGTALAPYLRLCARHGKLARVDGMLRARDSGLFVNGERVYAGVLGVGYASQDALLYAVGAKSIELRVLGVKFPLKWSLIQATRAAVATARRALSSMSSYSMYHGIKTQAREVLDDTFERLNDGEVPGPGLDSRKAFKVAFDGDEAYRRGLTKDYRVWITFWSAYWASVGEPLRASRSAMEAAYARTSDLASEESAQVLDILYYMSGGLDG